MSDTAAIDLLNEPGSRFELAEEDVRGIRMTVYKNRPRSLREVFTTTLSPEDDWAFLVYGDERIAAGEFVGMANAVAAALQTRFGVGKGDRVGILSANNPEWCATFWGTVNAGAIVAGLNGWWKTDEIVYGVRDSGSRVLVADLPRFERVADRLDELPSVEAVFLVDATDEDVARCGDARVHRFEELLATPDAAAPEGPPIAEDDAAMIIYTSGTTGRPKGAICPHRAMIDFLMNTMYGAAAQGGKWGTVEELETAHAADEPRNTQLLTTPLFHAGGCFGTLIVALFTRTRVAILKGKFDPVTAMELIERERVTAWATVPTMVWRVVEHPERERYDLSSLYTVAYGGSPSGEDLQRKCFETFSGLRNLSHVFGMTESGAVGTGIATEGLKERPTSVGRPVPTVRVRVVDEDDRDQPPGRPGEILLQGPGQMLGYWGQPEASAAALRDGWVHTGDIGVLDDEGYLFITDRAKDMIIRGGENISSSEIENRLIEHPDVAEAAIIGVPHPTLGEEVKAVVRPEPGAQLAEQGVRDWVAETLAPFKVPAHVELVDEPLPRSPTGKLLKNVLRGTGEVSFTELF